MQIYSAPLKGLCSAPDPRYSSSPFLTRRSLPWKKVDLAILFLLCLSLYKYIYISYSFFLLFNRMNKTNCVSSNENSLLLLSFSFFFFFFSVSSVGKVVSSIIIVDAMGLSTKRRSVIELQFDLNKNTSFDRGWNIILQFGSFELDGKFWSF